MYHLFKYKCILASLALALAACKKEGSFSNSGNGGNGGNGGSNQEMVTSTIKLLVINESNNGVSNAMVQVGTTVVYTNEFGYAELKNISVVANKALVKVKAKDYFEAYRTFAIDENECFGKVKLEPAKPYDIIQSANGATINISPESSVVFPPNAFALSIDGSDYNGSVYVYSSYLSPDDKDFNIKMPGDLVAEDNGNYVLKSYGMINVEMTTFDGRPLKLKENTKAKITAAIPNTLLSTAPATIPMWYFDTTKGVWLKDGVGTKQGNSYIAEVSHFTWWNYDVAYPRIFIEGRITNSNGIAIANSQIQMRIDSYTGMAVFSNTNNQGFFRIPAPQNAAISLIVTGVDCNLPFFTKTLTTTTSDIDLGTIIATNTSPNNYTVSGTFLNCNNQPVQSGSVKVYTANNVFEGNIVNGQFNVAFSVCRDSIDALIVAEDFANQKFSTGTTKMYKNITSVLGNINVCNTNAQYFIRYIVDGKMDYIPGNTQDQLSTYYFPPGNRTAWVQVAHNDAANQFASRIYFNCDIGGYAPNTTVTNMGGFVTSLLIKEYPGLSNMGGDFQLSNIFYTYNSAPGSNVRGNLKGRMLDRSINQWRVIDVVYSVIHK